MKNKYRIRYYNKLIGSAFTYANYKTYLGARINLWLLNAGLKTVFFSDGGKRNFWITKNYKEPKYKYYYNDLDMTYRTGNGKCEYLIESTGRWKHSALKPSEFHFPFRFFMIDTKIINNKNKILELEKIK